MQKPMSQSNGASPPPVDVRELRKVYRDIAAVDGISFSLQQRLDHGAARRQRRRQDHHHLHADGARRADLRRGARVRRRHGARAPQGAAPHELREPLRRRADAAHRAAEPRGVRQALRRARPQGAHRRDGGRVQARRAAGPALRQAVRRPEDARQPRQGAAQRAGAAAARRADRLARSRHGRLGALQARALLPRHAAPPSCWPRTTWRRWSAWPTG